VNQEEEISGSNISRHSAIIIITIVFAWFFWWTLEPWLNDPSRFSDLSTWLVPLVFLGLFISLASLSFLLVRNDNQKIILVLGVAVSFLFVFGYNHLYLIAFALLFLLSYRSMKIFDSEIEHRLKMKVGNIIWNGAPWLITSILVLISFAYYLTPDVQALAQSGELPKSFQRVVMTVVDQIFEGQTGLESGDGGNQVLSIINYYLRPYYKILPPLAAFGMFLILQGLSFIFIWVVVPISAFLFWLMKKSGIVNIETVKVDAERIKF